MITNANMLLPHPQTLCMTSPFQPFLFLSLWSARSFHQPPTLFLFIHAFFVRAPLSLSFSLSLPSSLLPLASNWPAV